MLSSRPKNKPEEEEINLDIEKLLSEADEEEYEGEEISRQLSGMRLGQKPKSDDENSKNDSDELKLGNKFSSRARRLQIFEEITIEEKWNSIRT